MALLRSTFTQPSSTNDMKQPNAKGAGVCPRVQPGERRADSEGSASSAAADDEGHHAASMHEMQQQRERVSVVRGLSSWTSFGRLPGMEMTSKACREWAGWRQHGTAARRPEGILNPYRISYTEYIYSYALVPALQEQVKKSPAQRDEAFPNHGQSRQPP